LDYENKGDGKMTSEEALKRLSQETAPNTVNDDIDKQECIDTISKDLEVLEILKKHLKVEYDKSSEFKRIVAFTMNLNMNYGECDPFQFCNFAGGLHKGAPKNGIEDFNKVKEWLEVNKE
jgi:hypothetical protein